MIDIARVGIHHDNTVNGYAEVLAAALRRDLPDVPAATARMVRSWHEHELPGRRTERYVASEGTHPVGRLELTFPSDAPRVAVQLDVVPARRRRGVGRQLFSLAIEQARAARRIVLTARTAWTLGTLAARDEGAGAAFATAVGLEPADLPEVMRCMTLPTNGHDLSRIMSTAGGAALGYRLVRWRDRTPSAYASDVAYLESRLSTDAPMGQLAHEEPELDLAWLQQAETALAARGQRSYHAGAVDSRTRRMVAWTMITKDIDQPCYAWQRTTIVDPAHRGHRLGLLVKATNIETLRTAEPDVSFIYTFNAAANTHMIAINEALGMQPIAAFQHWQRDI